MAGPVTAHVQFRNRSGGAAVINTAFNVFGDTRLDFHIVTPSGATPKRVMILYGKRPALGPRDFRKIRVGEIFEAEIDLARWYELTEEGTYTVEAEYSNSYEGRQLGRNVWTGRIKSPSRTFGLMKSG